MKCRLLVDCEGPNPEFSAEAKIKAEARGEIYPHHHTRVIPAGTIIDNPQAHYLCRPGYRNAPAKAEPADEACQQKLAQYMASRDVRLRQLKAVVDQHVGTGNPLPNAAAQKHIETLAEDYGLTPTPAEATDPIDETA